MANNLDLAMPIVEKDENGEFIATPYFEDAWFQIINSIGGEGAESIVDESASLLITPLLSKVAKLEKDLLNIEHPDQSQVKAKISNIKKELDNLSQIIAPITPLRAAVADLNTEKTEHEEVLAATLSELGFLRQIVNKLRSKTVKDFYTEVAKGNIPGHSLVHKFGRHQAVPNGSFEKLELVASNPAFLTAATTVRIKAGGNAADTAAGANAQSVIVEGIDSSLNAISELIITAGASASSATTASFWRVHRVAVEDVGTYGVANAAAITIEDSAGATDIIGIGLGEGQSQHAVYSIPTGFKGYLLNSLITVDAQKAADIKMLVRENFNDTSDPMSPIKLKRYFDGVLGVEPFYPKAPMELNALTDIWFEAEGAGAQTEVSVDFELLIIEDGF